MLTGTPSARVLYWSAQPDRGAHTASSNSAGADQPPRDAPASDARDAGHAETRHPEIHVRPDAPELAALVTPVVAGVNAQPEQQVEVRADREADLALRGRAGADGVVADQIVDVSPRLQREQGRADLHPRAGHDVVGARDRAPRAADVREADLRPDRHRRQAAAEQLHAGPAAERALV